MSGRSIAMLDRVRRTIYRVELARAVALVIALGWLSPLMGAPLSFGAAVVERRMEMAALPVFCDERMPPPLLALEPVEAAGSALERAGRDFKKLAAPASTESARPRVSRPFETLERMPAGYATLMVGVGSVLLIVSVVLGYVGRFTAPYSATGDVQAWGGRPPLPPLVVAPTAEMEARG